MARPTAPVRGFLRRLTREKTPGRSAAGDRKGFNTGRRCRARALETCLGRVQLTVRCKPRCTLRACDDPHPPSTGSDGTSAWPATLEHGGFAVCR